MYGTRPTQGTWMYRCVIIHTHNDLTVVLEDSALVFLRVGVVGSLKGPSTLHPTPRSGK